MTPTIGRALVLTAGVGRRARPLSFVRAKAALPVAGEPLVRRILRWLAGQGVGAAVLNLHHHPDTITRTLGDGSDLGMSVRYSWEQPLLGSAGGPRRALPLLDCDRFFVINGDTLTDLELAGLADAHARAGALVTMALVPNPAPHRYGGVVVDARGWITAFAPPGAAGASLHFIGVQVAEAAAFRDLPDGEPAESVMGMYRPLVERRAILGYHSTASFRDVGTPAEYLATCLEVAESEARPGSLIGEGCRVDPGARIERSVLWEDVEVGAGCDIVECVLASGVRVPPHTRLARKAVIPAASSAPGGPTELLAVDL